MRIWLSSHCESSDAPGSEVHTWSYKVRSILRTRITRSRNISCPFYMSRYVTDVLERNGPFMLWKFNIKILTLPELYLVQYSEDIGQLPTIPFLASIESRLAVSRLPCHYPEPRSTSYAGWKSLKPGVTSYPNIKSSPRECHFLQ